jgi:ATP-dependent DNA helicase RecG
MEREAILDLIAAGESLTTEFKRGSVTDGDIVTATCCLANARGGHLIIGVDDHGTVSGAPPRHGEVTEASRIAAMIANRTEPPLVPAVETVEVGGAEVIVIDVPAGTSIIATNDGRYLRRAVNVHGRPQCLPMRPHDILARAGSVGLQDYSRVVRADASMDDLDMSEFARFRDAAGAGGDRSLGDLSPIETLRALNLIPSDGEVTNGALLLFGRESSLARLLPTHEVAFAELDGLTVRASETSRAPLLRAMAELADRVRARNPEEEVELGLFRVGLPRFAEIAVRELIANALVHRDYTTIGSTRVEITPHQLTVSNPGGLPDGITLANLLTAPPRPRNPVLADAFKRAGLVERVGRGINRVFESQLAIGRPAPDFSRSTSSSVVADLRSGPTDTDLASFIAEARRDGRPFSLEDLLALHEVRQERQITVIRAAELFQVGDDAARATLNRLADRGLLESRGHGRGRSYHLSASLYRRLGATSEYVRARGFDDLQQEQMVMTYLAENGSITRREAAELCRIDPTAAGRLLKRLRAAGKLALTGERKGARYIQPDA